MPSMSALMTPMKSEIFMSSKRFTGTSTIE